MTVAIDTLEFARAFERAGFDAEKAGALASAFAKAQDAGREDLVTKPYLDTRFVEFEARMLEMEVRLVKQIGETGKDISNRLWTTTTIIAGVATAISGTIGAAVALIVRWGAM